MTDMDELIAEIRDLHERQDRREGELPMCLACSPADWPCDAVRAANALEFAEASKGRLGHTLTLALNESRKDLEAAESKLARIEAAMSGHPECDVHDDDDPITCGWKSAYASVVAALDGAPEPSGLPVEGGSK